MRMRVSHFSLPICGLLLLGLLAVGQTQELLPAAEKKSDAAMMQPLPVEDALAKARVNGKYSMLLRQIKVAPDAAMYKDFHDLGMREMTEYAGQTDLPKGHWVYVYPYWYIWRDTASTTKPKRQYGPEQLIGPPDVPASDSGNAWCSLTADEQDEWLLLEYAEPILPTAVFVYANYYPGAVSRVTVFKLDGTEVDVWEGEDPTPVDSSHGVSVIPFKVDFKVHRIKVYLASVQTPSWNEIDTVGVLDSDGKTHWPVAAEASSTWAQQYPSTLDTGFVVGVDPNLMERIKGLENEVQELKELLKNKNLETEVRELKDMVKELKEMLKKKEQ